MIVIIGAIEIVAILLGAADLPVIVGIGLLVVATGRAIGKPAQEAFVHPVGALLVGLAGALALLRWETTSLDQLRAVQAVIGPTLVVEPNAAAVGAGIAAGAGLLGLALLVGRPAQGILGAIAWALASASGGLVLAASFFGPYVRGWGTQSVSRVDVATVAAAAAVAAVAAAGLGLLAAALRPLWRWGIAGVGGVAMVVAGVLVTTAL